jgi:hypothetical protein
MRLPGSRGRKRLGPTRQDHGAPHTTRGGHHSQRREIDSSLNASMGIAPSVQLAAFPGPSAWSGSGASWSALCQFVQAASGRPCSSACTKDHHRLQKLQRREGGLSPRNNKAEHKGHDQRWQRSFTNKVPNNGFPLAWRLSRLQVSRTSRAACLIVAVVWAKVEGSFADGLSGMTCPPPPNNRSGSGLFLP